MKTNKALIITGKMVQDHEFIYPYYRLKEDNYNVDIATIDGLETTGQIGVKVIPNKITSEIGINEYDVLVLPGGAKCMEYLRQDKNTINYIKNFYETGKVIGSICHAAQLLISAKIVNGKKISGYYSLKDDIENAGARYIDEPVVIDGNIISTAHYKDMGIWMKTVIEKTKLYTMK
jgi:protease I